MKRSGRARGVLHAGLLLAAVTLACSFPGAGLDATPVTDAGPSRPCTTDADCSSAPATPRCDLAAGFCVACLEGGNDCSTAEAPTCSPIHECSGCGTAADCERFADQPLCDVAAGHCVTCVDSRNCATPAAPVCDDGACRACGADDECPSGLCRELDGTCFDAASVVYVAPGGVAGTCTLSQPCATIAQGLARISGARPNLLVRPKAGGYSEQLDINNRSFTLFGAGAELTAPVEGPLVTVRGTSAIEIQGLRLHGARGLSGNGILCQGGAGTRSVTLRSVRLESNAHCGIDTSSCAVAVDRSLFSNNRGGGLSASGGVVTVRNSVFLANGTATGPDATSFGATLLDGIAAASAFEFNTVSENVAGGSNPRGVKCIVAVDPLPISSSIVGGSGIQVGADCLPRYLLSTDALTARGGGNITGRATFAADGFHLLPASLGIAAADPAAAVMFDYDGDARSLPATGASDIGADEVVP